MLTVYRVHLLPHAAPEKSSELLEIPSATHALLYSQKGMDGVVFLPLQVIRDATGSFSKEHEIGEGAFARVYKGFGPSGEEWAVKRSKYRSRGQRMVFDIEVIPVRKTSLVLEFQCDAKAVPVHLLWWSSIHDNLTVAQEFRRPNLMRAHKIAI